jgi:hypothetical protein
MSDNNSLRPYLMPAPRETPSSQLVVQRRPLPSSAPKRTAAQMDEVIYFHDKDHITKLTDVGRKPGAP